MQPFESEILGIVNITEDSFSDGGQYLQASALRRRILDLAGQGCRILDLGAASSNPASHPVETREEIRRLKMALEIIRDCMQEGLLAPDTRISVDSFNPEVQLFALRNGAHFLNDISGFRHPQIYSELASSQAQLIVMHAIQEGVATETNVDPDIILDSIKGFFQKRLGNLMAAGINRDRLVMDPGMGFFLGSNPECSYRVLRNLDWLREEFGLPLLVSVSRKSFLGAITGRSPGEREPATLACELYLAEIGIDYIRTHNVQALKDSLLVRKAISSPLPPASEMQG